MKVKSTRQTRISSLADARLNAVGSVDEPAEWRMKSHFHGFNELIIIFKGTLRLLADGKRHSGKPGDVFLYPAGLAHTESSEPGRPFETIFLSFSMDPLAGAPFRRKHDQHGRIREMARWLHAGRHSSDRIAVEQNNALLHAVLAEFFKQPDENRIVEQVRSHIMHNIASGISLESLAATAGLSKFHFTRQYRKLTGRTPMAEVRAIRSDCARELILSTDLPLKAIAPRVGLGNEQALSRTLTAHFGMNPSQIRRFKK